MINKPEFYEKLRTLLNSGISVKKALEIVESREKGPLRKITGEIRRSIDSGETLSASLESSSKIFTPFETSLIHSGEVTGNLEKNLDYLISHLNKTRAWRRKIITGLIYPFILFHAAVLLPPLSILIMEGFPPYARAVRGPFIFLYLSFFAFFLLRRIIKKSPGISFFCEKIFWRIPVSGRVRKNLALSRFLKSLGYALKAGLNPDRALEVSSDSSGSAVIESSIPGAPLEKLKREGITGILKASGLMPGMLLDLVYTGEESGTVDDSLIYIADTLEKDAETLMARLVILLPVIIYLVVAAYIASIILRFYAGLYGDIIAF